MFMVTTPSVIIESAAARPNSMTPFTRAVIGDPSSVPALTTVKVRWYLPCCAWGQGTIEER